MAWDNQEFAVVFNELYPNLCRFLGSLLGGNAQDIAQEAFIRLYRKGNAGLTPDEARFWIYRVARNLALNELNKTRTRDKHADSLRLALDQRRAEHPEKQYELSERKQIVTELLEALPEHQRAALVLREQQEMSYAQIARVLDVSESKVKVDIHRARMRLREKWNAIHEPRAAVK